MKKLEATLTNEE